MPRALITGGSAGLGRALASALSERGWDVVITARHPEPLVATARELGPCVTPVVGDVMDADHRDHLAHVAGSLDLLVNNASTLGASPLPRVLDLSADVLHRLWETNVVAPVELIQRLRAQLTPTAAVVNITSDAAVEHYETWGGYAATKAALEHLTLTLAAEDRDVRWWAVDPGDLRTQMHQDAFPGEDISDRPLPETVVPAFLRLLEVRPPSGRYRAAELASAGAAA